ncbi:MAG TPA: heparan-alpha-glucosaminide N-acetyltransferase domain-containing protein, partial [Vicinamibacterales bacterium]|nr:heparan-alpha-glucosaminide N-acetyltransferase domain-containing protein [Vicinamibacterales bacterium]
MSATQVKPAAPAAGSPAAIDRVRMRVATIDWMRGLVMILMVVDHADMAFDGGHLDEDSAMYPNAMTMALPAAEFFTRWLTHICAPTFLFLAGTALAMSVERRAAKGENAWGIDKGILTRGAIIALLDPTIVSLGSGRWTFQVLLAIGVAMMCMALLRR